MASPPTWQCCCWLKFAESRSIVSDRNTEMYSCHYYSVYHNSWRAQRSRCSIFKSNSVLSFRNWCSLNRLLESFPFLNPIFLSLPDKYFQKMSKLLGLVLNKCVFTWQSRPRNMWKYAGWFHAITNKEKSYLQHRKIHYGFAWKSKMALH